jgi:hypothetical protein
MDGVSLYKSNFAVSTIAAAGATTLTPEAHLGTVVSNLAAAQTWTLPAATGSGNKYEIIVLITKTGDLVIQVANASDTMSGNAILAIDAAETVIMFATGATSDTVTLDGTTSGGIIGARVTLIDIAANKWFVEVASDASGTEVTPFSADVS